MTVLKQTAELDLLDMLLVYYTIETMVPVISSNGAVRWSVVVYFPGSRPPKTEPEKSIHLPLLRFFIY